MEHSLQKEADNSITWEQYKRMISHPSFWVYNGAGTEYENKQTGETEMVWTL